MAYIINAWECAALLGEHKSISRNGLFKTLQNPKPFSDQRSISSWITDGLINWAVDRNNWPTPIRSTKRSTVLSPDNSLEIQIQANAYRMNHNGHLATMTAHHLPAFTYSREWARAGVPPRDFILMAQWIMHLHDSDEHMFVVLHDKSAMIHFVDRNTSDALDMIEACTDMARRLQENDPPKIDEPKAGEDVIAKAAGNRAPANPNDLVALADQWLAARARQADATTALKNTGLAYERTSAALKDALAPGSHVETQGIRIHHNAQTGRLMEENLNVSFF